MKQKKLFAIMLGVVACALVATIVWINVGGTASKKVQIAMILPLTGPAASLGEDEKVGIDIAVADFAKEAELVSLIYEDSQSKPEVTVSAVKKQIDINGTRIFFISTTAPTQAALPILKQANTDVLAFVAVTMPNITDGYPFAYRIYPNVTEEIKTLADFAKHKGYRRIGGFCPQNRVGEESLKELKSLLEADGGTVPIVESFAMAEKDFRSLLLKFKGQNLDAICITGCFPMQYEPILKQMVETGIDVPLLCGIGMTTAGLEKKFSAEFLSKITFPAPPLYFSTSNPDTVKFIQAVRAKGKEPNYDVAYAYDGTALLLRAIATADSTNSKDITIALNKLIPFNGASGPIKFDEKRDAYLGLRVCQWGPEGIQVAE